MSGDIDNGGPAFPFEEKCADGTHYHDHAGMSLRDYFAAHRPAPTVLSRAWGEVVVGPYPKVDGLDAPYGLAVVLWWADVEAAWSYIQADAMLRARKSAKIGSASC